MTERLDLPERAANRAGWRFRLPASASTQFTRFILVGLANTAACLGVIYAGKWLGGLSDSLANFLGYSVGLLLSFVLNSSWTFRQKRLRLPTFVGFLAVFAVAYSINIAIVLGLISTFGINGYIAQAAGVPAYTLCFFYLSRRYVFVKR